MRKHDKSVLTVHIDLRGNFELGVDGFELLQTKLDKHFMKKLPERPVHPSNLLNSSNSFYPAERKTFLSIVKRIAKNIATGQFYSSLYGDLAIYATHIRKRSNQ